jgi:large subunit ribosomal protein L18e
MERKKTNPHLQHLIEVLRSTSAKEGVGVWKRVASDLSKGTSHRRVVNLSRINRNAKKDEHVIIPGKVLASGELTQPVHVAAYAFSTSAKEKIEQANGSIMTIHQLLEKNPKGKEVRILG